jgi:hypothetical protein
MHDGTSAGRNTNVVTLYADPFTQNVHTSPQLCGRMNFPTPTSCPL